MRISIYTTHMYPWKKSLVDDLSLHATVSLLFLRSRGTRDAYKKWSFESQCDKNKVKKVLHFCLSPTNVYVCLDSMDLGNVLLFAWFKLRRVRTLNIVAENRVYYNTSNRILFFLSRIKRILDFWAIRNSDAIIAESEASKNFLVEIGCELEKITMIPHGVDLSAFQQIGIEPRDKLGNKVTVLYAGGFYPHKGYVQLLEAIRSGQLNDLIFWVIALGDVSVARLFRALANVRLFSVRSYHEMVQLYRDVDIVIVPSVRSQYDTERSPNVIIEAMAAGCAVVGTNVGGIPTYIGDAGLVIESASSKSIVQALRTLAYNPSLLETYKRKSACRASEIFDIKKYSHRLLLMCAGNRQKV